MTEYNKAYVCLHKRYSLPIVRPYILTYKTPQKILELIKDNNLVEVNCWEIELPGKWEECVIGNVLRKESKLIGIIKSLEHIQFDKLSKWEILFEE